MDSGNEPAYPTETDGHKFEGLTKRELFAMAAMQGLCACDASPNYDKGPHNVAIVERAVVLADRLLSELEKGNG